MPEKQKEHVHRREREDDTREDGVDEREDLSRELDDLDKFIDEESLGESREHAERGRREGQ